jgi:hypothetical protein
MNNKIAIAAALALVLGVLPVNGQSERPPLPNLPQATQKPPASRVSKYVNAYRTRDWKALYDLVSEVGKGGVDRQRFITAMKAKHGTGESAGMPNLLAFTPDRSEKDAGGVDIYGCAKAKREGEVYTGIGVIHAVYEHDDWFFSGWSFTAFPNQPCKLLSDPTWKPSGPMEWNQPMEEIRDAIDAPQ